METQPVKIVDTEKPIDVKVVAEGTPQDVNITGTKEPIPVQNIGGNEEPVNVKVIEGQTEKPRIVSKGDNQTLAPTTTHQEDVTRAGQRQINRIWEITQAIIAVSITLAIIYMAIKGLTNEPLTNAFFLIVAMYFVRTNHQLVGGVGAKNPNQSR